MGRQTGRSWFTPRAGEARCRPSTLSCSPDGHAAGPRPTWPERRRPRDPDGHHLWPCPSPQIPVPALPVGGSQGRGHPEGRGSETLPEAWPQEGHRAGESHGQPQPEWAGGAELRSTGSSRECCPGRLLLGTAEGVAPNVPEWSPEQGTHLLVEEGAGRAVSPPGRHSCWG